MSTPLSAAIAELLAEVPVGRRPEALRKIQGVMRLSLAESDLFAAAADAVTYPTRPCVCIASQASKLGPVYGHERDCDVARTAMTRVRGAAALERIVERERRKR